MTSEPDGADAPGTPDGSPENSRKAVAAVLRDSQEASERAIALKRLVDNHQQAMGRLTDPLKRLVDNHQQAMGRLTDPLKRLVDNHQQAMERLTDPLKRLMDDLDRVNAPFRRLMEDHQRTFGPLSRSFDAMKTLAEPEWLKSFARLERMAFGDAVTRGLAQGLLGHRLSDHATFASALSRQFSFRVPSTTLAALAGVHETADRMAAISRSMAGMTILRPGFQMAAVLGLEGMAARGVVADVLHHYEDQPLDDALIFGSALQAAHAVDADAFSDADAEAFVRRVWDLFLSLMAQEADALRRNGLLTTFLFIMALVYAHQNLEATKKGAAVMTTAWEDVRNGVADLRADIQLSDARTRYVHARAPLRAEPHARAMLLRIVYPEQALRAIDRQGRWVFVEVFDYKSDSPVTGWINSDHLRLQPRR